MFESWQWHQYITNFGNCSAVVIITPVFTWMHVLYAIVRSMTQVSARTSKWTFHAQHKLVMTEICDKNTATSSSNTSTLERSRHNPVLTWYKPCWLPACMSLRDVALTPSHTAPVQPYAATDSAGSVDCLMGNDTSAGHTHHTSIDIWKHVQNGISQVTCNDCVMHCCSCNFYALKPVL